VSYYDRTIEIPSYKFSCVQLSSFSETTYNHTTIGAFVQNTWNATEKFILETGLRGDYQNEYGFFALPRISAMYKIHPKLTMRLGGGLGYKTPNVFTEDAERIQFRNVLPIDVSKTKATPICKSHMSTLKPKECSRLFKCKTLQDSYDLINTYLDFLIQVINNHHSDEVFSYAGAAFEQPD